MGRQFIIFLDDAGTMTDPQRRAQQLRRAVGYFLSRHLGGGPAMWADAHDAVLAQLWDDYRQTMFGNVTADYRAFRRRWLLGWVQDMYTHCGVQPPPVQVCLDLALRAEAYATRQVRSAFPGAVEVIQTLAARGHTLHTASSEDSAELAGYLEGMGVRPCFGRLYGPNLIGTIKEGPPYYTRIFADAGVAPEQALVVDDSPLAIGWAAETGAWTARIGTPPGNWPAPDLQLESLAQLPEAIRVLEDRPGTMRSTT
ncbi:MAG: HAD family hydrolase, partial [Chloroflexota bacterium]